MLKIHINILASFIFHHSTRVKTILMWHATYKTNIFVKEAFGIVPLTAL